MINLLARIPDCDSHSPALVVDLFLSSDSVAFPPLENSDHVVVSVSIVFLSNTNRDVFFHCTAYGYFRANKGGFRKNLGGVPWENIFKLGASVAATGLCEWVQVGFNVYVPHRKYQVNLIHPLGLQLLALQP